MILMIHILITVIDVHRCILLVRCTFHQFEGACSFMV